MMRCDAVRPAWINKKIDFRSMHATEGLLGGLRLHTVCHQARCPNISECFERGTATFLILGDACTRACRFCGVAAGKPAAPDPCEPGRVAEAVRRMAIRHAVVTSVTRDDLHDGGASLFAETVRAIRSAGSCRTIEVLVPDFRGDESSICTVIESGPDVFGHNIETVPELYASMNRSDYARSLGVIASARKLSSKVRTKSSIMLGLGESRDQVLGAMRDLRSAGCDYLSIGQYLQPVKCCIPVREYVAPDRFDEYGERARDMGFLHVESGVYVRSSYMAEKYNA